MTEKTAITTLQGKVSCFLFSIALLYAVKFENQLMGEEGGGVYIYTYVAGNDSCPKMKR